MEGGSSSIATGRYRYVHDVSKGPPEAIDVHHLMLQRNASSKASILLLFFLLPCSLLLQARSIGVLLWSLPVMAVVVRMYLRRVVRESVIILPGFGVQLETQYRRGRIIRRFVPSSKILKPVLTECVTPVTCYWSLSLIIHGEEQLLVVFKELCPPVKTLVPIWKALCASIECGEHIHE
nr:GPI-GlcNAc transferase complex, PIG-H component [Ipomoea batatas]GME03811.1 GPI-GlcNAc transferase complex, PIG-H component [Ipomoea batatas]